MAAWLESVGPGSPGGGWGSEWETGAAGFLWKQSCHRLWTAWGLTPVTRVPFTKCVFPLATLPRSKREPLLPTQDLSLLIVMNYLLEAFE